MTFTQTGPDVRSLEPAEGHGGRRWPAVGIVAGVLGIVATLATDLHPNSSSDTITTSEVVEDVSRGAAHVGVVAGYLVIACLLVLAAAWRVHVEPRVMSSTAARVVPAGLTAAAGALALGYGYKGMFAVYLPGGLDEDLYDTAGLYVMYLLNDFGGYIGWIGVTVSAAAVAWMSLHERTISRWIGIFSLFPILAVTAMTVGTGLPGFPGVVMPLWLIVTSTGLMFGRSPIVR